MYSIIFVTITALNCPLVFVIMLLQQNAPKRYSEPCPDCSLIVICPHTNALFNFQSKLATGQDHDPLS